MPQERIGFAHHHARRTRWLRTSSALVMPKSFCNALEQPFASASVCTECHFDKKRIGRCCSQHCSSVKRRFGWAEKLQECQPCYGIVVETGLDRLDAGFPRRRADDHTGGYPGIRDHRLHGYMTAERPAQQNCTLPATPIEQLCHGLSITRKCIARLCVGGVFGRAVAGKIAGHQLVAAA